MRVRIDYAAIAVCLTVQSAWAQNVAVQQPVVENFGVSTVVVVPDRGSVLLGGVGTAADSTSQFGFSPLGSSIGLERTHGSAWASVYVHDFEAMDAALLNAASVNAGPEAAVLANPRAASAYASLMKGRRPSQAQKARLHGGATSAATRKASGAVLRTYAPSLASSPMDASSRSTNSGVNPAASRAAR